MGGAEVCDRLQIISVESGEPRWADPVDLTVEGYSGWLGKIGGTSLSISDTLVTAAHAGHNAQAEHSTDLLWADVRTGEVLGSTDAGAEPVYNYCTLTGYAQALGDRVVAVAQCPAFTSPSLITWTTDSGEWKHNGGLDGCARVSNLTTSAYLTNEHDRLLIACFTSGLNRLYEMTDDALSSPEPVGLDGVAVDAITTVGSTYPPENIVPVGEGLFMVRGTRGTTDGVVSSPGGSSGYPWQFAVAGASQVRLMAATDTGATVLVTTPGPATLHTVTGPNRAAAGLELDPDVADRLPSASQAIRVSDYLVCGFTGIDPEETVIGVIRVEN